MFFLNFFKFVISFHFLREEMGKEPKSCSFIAKGFTVTNLLIILLVFTLTCNITILLQILSSVEDQGKSSIDHHDGIFKGGEEKLWLQSPRNVVKQREKVKFPWKIKQQSSSTTISIIVTAKQINASICDDERTSFPSMVF